MVTLDQAGVGRGRILDVEALRARVEHVWVEYPATSGTAVASWRVVADPCSHLLYHRHRDGTSRLMVAGPRTVAVDIDKRRRRLTVGVRLRSWAVPALLDVPPAELVDRAVRLDALGPGRDAAELDERLSAAGDDEVCPTLVAWLVRRAEAAERPSERRARVAALALQRSATCRDAARTLGRSTRALRSLVMGQVGLSPKTFTRLVRLHRALHLMREPGWSRIAVAAGYYDQAHLIREFRRLLGQTPEAWKRRGTAGRRDPDAGRSHGVPERCEVRVLQRSAGASMATSGGGDDP